MAEVDEPDADDLAAAELVLRLPDDATCADLRLRAEGDAAFAARIVRWEERLAPLIAEATAVPPPPGVLARIMAGIVDPVAALRGRLRRWQWTSGAMGAIAATLALLLARPAPPPPVAPPAPIPQLAVAQLSDDRGTPLLAVGIERRSGQVSVRLQDLPREARVPELWLIPAGQAPRSLGLIAADGRLDARLPTDLRGAPAQGATLAVSLETPAGAPHAAPAGPIVATGALITI